MTEITSDTNFHQVVYIKSSSQPINYKPLFSVDSKYIPQAISMSQIFQRAIDPKTLELNFEKAIGLVNDHPNMAIVSTTNQIIQQSNAEVAVMVDQLDKLLKSVLGVALDTEQQKVFTAAIKQGFTNLSVQQGDAWIFWQKEQATKTTYQYNILFAIQNEFTGAVMAALPIGLTISVNIKKEQVLFIKITDKHEYSVHVKAISVVEPLRV